MVLPARPVVQMGAGFRHRATHGVDGRASLSTMDGTAWPAWLVPAGFFLAGAALLSHLGLFPLRHSRHAALVARGHNTIPAWRRALRLGHGDARGGPGACVPRRLCGVGADST